HWRRKLTRRTHVEAKDTVDDARRIVQAGEHGVVSASGGIWIKAQVRILHRTIDPPAKRHAEQIGKAEVLSAAAAVDVVADGAALRVGERRGIGQDNKLEPIQAIRREKRLVHQLEWHARL